MLDRYVGNAEVFPVLRKWDYFNHAGASPWPVQTSRALADFAHAYGEDCFMTHKWFAQAEALRPVLARLVNAAHADEIALMRNTADGICAIATGIAWQPGDRIVLPAVEYPSNVYPWMEVAQRFGVELMSVPEITLPDGTVRVPEADLIAAADHPRTRALVTSHVQWTSGQRMNLDLLGDFCRSRGIYLAVDAIQSAGVVPIDVQRMKIDFLFTGGHKWLMSPPGSGFLYCRRELTQRVSSPIVGLPSMEDAFSWELKFQRRPDAGRFEIGTQAFPSLIGMRPSIDLLLEVGIESIHRHVCSLGDWFTEAVRSKGYTVVSSREAGATSGAICFTSRSHKPGHLVNELRTKHRIELADRLGRLRFAPHFYNTLEQVERLIDVLPQN